MAGKAFSTHGTSPLWNKLAVLGYRFLQHFTDLRFRTYRSTNKRFTFNYLQKTFESGLSLTLPRDFNEIPEKIAIAQ